LRLHLSEDLMNTRYFSAGNSLKALWLAGLFVAQSAFSHGYVSLPGSRVAFCKTGGGNTNCGNVQYEPQSVEGPDGFPGAGPGDGSIAAGGSPSWAPLNEQNANRWKKVGIGKTVDIEWTFTANHKTKDWKYYITKTNWNPNAPLTRNSFDLKPFCTVNGNNVQPPMKVTHKCTLPDPARQGYHVILAVWDVGDTVMSFYNVMDVQIGGGGAVNPAPAPTPKPTAPTPAPKPTPAPTSDPNCVPAGGGGKKVCTAIPGSGGDNAWCNANCNHFPAFCPAQICKCN
jgi:predicted carbohydrate-binding protein with CBM5 and CBM33 domain